MSNSKSVVQWVPWNTTTTSSTVQPWRQEAVTISVNLPLSKDSVTTVSNTTFSYYYGDISSWFIPVLVVICLIGAWLFGGAILCYGRCFLKITKLKNTRNNFNKELDSQLPDTMPRRKPGEDLDGYLVPNELQRLEEGFNGYLVPTKVDDGHYDRALSIEIPSEAQYEDYLSTNANYETIKHSAVYEEYDSTNRTHNVVMYSHSHQS